MKNRLIELDALKKPAIANLRKALLRKRLLEPVLERSSSAAEGVV